jgi:fidgetin-like protein 1
MKNLVKDASLGPIREQIRQGAKVVNLEKEKIRPVTLQVCNKVHTEYRNFKNVSMIDY